MRVFEKKWIAVLALCFASINCSLVFDMRASERGEPFDPWLFWLGSFIGFIFCFCGQFAVDAFLKKAETSERMYRFYVGFFAYGGLVAVILAPLLRLIGEEGPFFPLAVSGAGFVAATLLIVINAAEKEEAPQ